MEADPVTYYIAMFYLTEVYTALYVNACVSSKAVICVYSSY
jgi:hypothetical protein